MAPFLRRLAVVLCSVLAAATFVGCGSDGSDGRSDVEAGDGSDGAASASGVGDGDGQARSLAAKGASTTLDPRGEGPGLHCGLPTATAPTTPDGVSPPSTAFARPVNDFPLEATLKPGRGDPGDKVKLAVTAGRPGALIIVFGAWTDGKDHGTRYSAFADVAGHSEFSFKVPAGIPPGQARIVVSANFKVADETQSAMVQETFIVTGPGCP